MLQKVLEQPHVALATGTVEHGTLFERVNGVDFDGFNKMSGGLIFIDGRVPAAPDEIVVDDYYARQHKLRTGDHYRMMDTDWKVSGIVETGKGSRVFIPLRTLQDKMANPGKISVIYVKADTPANIPVVLAELKQLLPDNPIYTLEEFLSQIMLTISPEDC